MPKVKFLQDASRELKYLREFSRAMGKTKLTNSAQELLEMDDETAIEKLKRSYGNLEFRLFAKEIEKSWRKVEKKYMKRIVEITGHPWESKEYECVLTSHVPGLAAIPERNVVAIGREYARDGKTARLPTEAQMYVLAHELFHQHYFDFARTKGLPIEAAGIAMVETTPLLVFFSDSELSSNWPSMTLERTRGAYKEVQENFDSANDLWNKRESYTHFLESFVRKIKSGKKT